MKTRHLRLFIFTLIYLLTSGCEDVDLMLAVGAGLDAVKSIALTDKEIKEMAVQTSELSDSRNTIAPSDNKYGQRLKKLTDNHLAGKDLFNFRVYLSPEVNAFAMADGTIRIYSGLMDMMNDSELLFVIGHEIGHVEAKHISKQIRLAYAGRAVRKGAASINNEVGYLARSQLGGFAEKLLNAQFSQLEEREADDLGLDFLASTGNDPMASVSALRKLATLGNNHTFLSTHPAPGERADRLEAKLNGSRSVPGSG